MIYEKLGNLKKCFDEVNIDLFICSASYEDRSISIAKSINSSNIVHSIIAFNKEFAEASSQNFNFLQSTLGQDCSAIELDTNNPLNTADVIAQEFERLNAKPIGRIVIDITAFTRESLLIILKYVVIKFSDCAKIEFLYANAKEYSVGNSIEDKWLSRGNREIRSVLGYPGMFRPSRSNHLIVLVGFEHDRALSLIEEWDPAKISLGIGDENQWATQGHQQANQHRLDRLQRVVDSDNKFVFNGYDAKETKDAIHKLIQNSQDYNNILAPMNTKISTIGAGIVAIEDESIQLCYVQPNVYNTDKYSTPGDYFFYFSLDEIKTQ